MATPACVILGADVYKRQIQSNLQVSQKKVEKPAVPVKLQDIQSLVDELDEIIVFGNKLIQANNDAFNKKRETKVQCRCV